MEPRWDSDEDASENQTALSMAMGCMVIAVLVILGAIYWFISILTDSRWRLKNG